MERLVARSVAEVVAHCRTLSNAWSEATGRPAALWYRGHQSAEWELTPSLLRPQNKALLSGEESIYFEYQLNAPRFPDCPSEHQGGPYAWLCSMQHHGLPTRLLDWTTRPIKALYFAVANADGSSDAAIWILQPSAWNATFHTDPHVYAAVSGLSSRIQDTFSRYMPWHRNQSRDLMPMAIMVPQTEPRLSAQAGAFTIHGWNPQSIAAAAEARGFVQLQSIHIPKDSVLELRRSLLEFWCKETDVFPDLDALSRQIARSHRESASP